MPAMMSMEAYDLYDRVCRTVSLRKRALTWDQLRAAKDLAVEVHEPETDPSKVASLAEVLGLTESDVEALTALPVKTATE